MRQGFCCCNALLGVKGHQVLQQVQGLRWCLHRLAQQKNTCITIRAYKQLIFQHCSDSFVVRNSTGKSTGQMKYMWRLE